jgi:adenylate cyclase
MPNAEIRAVAEWLIDGARSAPLPQQILAQLCDRLVACGIPLWRAAVFVRTLHPNVMGRRFVWRPGAEVEVREAPFELLETSDFLDSTIARVYLTADPVRRRLAVPHPVLDFPILSELRAEGVTDYFAAPLVFTDGTIHVATWTTREPRGFTDEQIAGIEAIMTSLARVGRPARIDSVPPAPKRTKAGQAHSHPRKQSSRAKLSASARGTPRTLADDAHSLRQVPKARELSIFDAG